MRSALAVILTIGFYGLAISIVALLLFLFYAQIVYGHRFNLHLTIFCLAGAGIIAWSILPRWDRFDPPGPRLQPDAAPALFAEIERIAERVGQRPPEEVYLIGDVNAFVVERGGMLGIGRRRIMGIGLPLLNAVSVQQFKAILAHEFGHFDNGDTKLGPWIYRTRMAILRTVESLRGRSILHYPFYGYGVLFLRTTNAISRHQEYIADALAADTMGATSLIDGLRAIHETAVAYNAYWESELAVVLKAGFEPPLKEGFSAFRSSPSVKASLARFMENELKEGKVAPYDTHPPLKDRIEAVRDFPAEKEDRDDRSAASLLADAESLERKVFQHWISRSRLKITGAIRWQDVGERVYVPLWKQRVIEASDVLEGVTLDQVPGLIASPEPVVSRIEKMVGGKPSKEEAGRILAETFGLGVALVLARKGWVAQSLPGEDLVLRRDGATYFPFTEILKLKAGVLNADDWLAGCRKTAIGDVDFGAMAREVRDEARAVSQSTKAVGNPPPVSVKPRVTVVRDVEQIEFCCSECGVRMAAPASQSGMVVRCPACNERVVVP